MNPWLYLLTIPICALAILKKNFIKNIMRANYTFIIILLVLLIILFYLYTSNIIGLLDLIMLMLIFSMMLNPFVGITILANVILIPLATILSFINRK